MEDDKEKITSIKKSQSKENSPSLTSEDLEMFAKVEEKIKSESEQNLKDLPEETYEPQDRTLYAYCSVCKENIFIHYNEDIVKNASSYPVYLVWVHGKPFHGLLVRIDKNYVSRGERVVQLEFDPEL